MGLSSKYLFFNNPTIQRCFFSLYIQVHIQHVHENVSDSMLRNLIPHTRTKWQIMGRGLRTRLTLYYIVTVHWFWLTNFCYFGIRMVWSPFCSTSKFHKNAQLCWWVPPERNTREHGAASPKRGALWCRTSCRPAVFSGTPCCTGCQQYVLPGHVLPSNGRERTEKGGNTGCGCRCLGLTHQVFLYLLIRDQRGECPELAGGIKLPPNATS